MNTIDQAHIEAEERTMYTPEREHLHLFVAGVEWLLERLDRDEIAAIICHEKGCQGDYGCVEDYRAADLIIKLIKGGENDDTE